MNQRSLRVVRILSWLAFLGWGALCVYLSQQGGAESGRMSLKIARFVGRVLSHLTDKTLDLSALHRLVREFAHFFIHFMLATLAGFAFLTTVKNSLTGHLVAFFVSLLVATGDEFVQLVATGRTFELLDLGLNLIGVIAGSTLSLIIMSFVTKVLPKRFLQTSA